MTAETHPIATLLAGPLPEGWWLSGAVVQPVHPDVGRLQLRLRHPNWPDQTLVLDARSDSAAPNGPFSAPPWRLTYRHTAVPFAAFAAVGQVLAQQLATLGSLDSWPVPSAVAKVRDRRPQPQQSWFVRESALTVPLLSLQPDQRPAWLVSRLARHCPQPGPIHLQLYLEGRCLQRCQFCTVPLENDRPAAGPQPPQCQLVADGVLEALLALLATRPGSLLTLLGDDWAAHPERDAWLALLQRDHGVRLGLLGPGTALANPNLRQAVARIAGLDHLTVTLEARPDTAEGRACHDAIVGQMGAAEQLSSAIEPLLAAGIPLAVASVLVAGSLAQLPELLRFCADHGLELALSGFVPDRCDVPVWQPAEHMARADQVLAVLAATGPLATQVLTRVAGLPLCAIPDQLHNRTSLTWPSEQAEPWVQPLAGPCGGCSAAARCSGVPISYLKAHGAYGLRALST